MRAAETCQGGNVSKQLDWLRHTGYFVVEDDGRTGCDVNLRHDDAGIGAVICDQTAPVDCVGCQGILFRFVKVFLTWKIDMIGQGGLGTEQHGSRRRAAQGWASISARH